MGGHLIKAGEMVLCSLSGADRDAALSPVGADLDPVDARRTITSHLAFGYGIHRCVGAELAKIELRIAYPALLQRFPDLRLDVADDRIAFRPYSIVYGVDSLPMAF